MTLSKEGFQFITKIFPDNVYGKGAPCDELKKKLPDDLKNKIGVYCEDVMGRLRAIGDRPEPDYPGDRAVTSSCQVLLYKIVTPILSMLSNTNIHTYVVCLDTLYNSRPEKGATRKKRTDRLTGVQKITIPWNQKEYFEHDKPLPGNMTSIFYTPSAREALYEYICGYMKSSNFCSRIPKNKQVILSGGFFQGKQLPPLELRQTTIIPLHTRRTDKIHEGDLDVWRWTHIFCHDNVIVYSRDREVLLIGLIQARQLFKLDKNRKIYFWTRGSVGTIVDKNYAKVHAQRYARYVQAIQQGKSREMARSLSNGVDREKPRAQIIFEDCVIDIGGAWTTICTLGIKVNKEQSHEYGKVKKPSIHDTTYLRYYGETTPIKRLDEYPLITNLAEVLVIMATIVSTDHDYLCGKYMLSGVRDPFLILQTVSENLIELGQMVRVTKSERHHEAFDYHVNVSVLLRWIEYVHLLAAIKRNKYREDKETYEQYWKRIEQKWAVRREKHIKPQLMYAGASHAAWVLHYYGNGHLEDFELLDGVATKKNNVNVFAYGKDSFLEHVFEQDIVFTW